MIKHRNIKFYSAQDLNSGHYLKETESVFTNWDEHIKSTDINIILELFNIKKYFDAGLRLKHWSDEQFNAYTEKCKTVSGVLCKFCSIISDDNLTQLYEATDSTYTDDLWELICSYKVYQRITPTVLGQMLNISENIVWEVLSHKELVKSFGQVLAEHLSHNSYTPEKLISHYLENHECNNHQIYFPAEFTQEMRDKSLTDYIERDDVNFNYLQLLERAQSTKEFPLSNRLRLKAKKKREALQETLFSNSPKVTYSTEVSFKSIPDGSIEASANFNSISCSYSREWIEENQDYPTLLNNFIYLFGYVDHFFRCNFVSMKNDLSVTERFFGAKGNKDYETGLVFNAKRFQSLLQMDAYNQELQRLNIRLEDIIKWFFEDYLQNEFGAEGFTYTPPSVGTTYAEKCKLMCISIDGALKQYRLYCEDGVVDRELLEMSSEHIIFSELSSVLHNKYGYAASDDIRYEMYLLFSDQSTISYTNKTKDKYETLPDLLFTEHMKKEDFDEIHHKDIEWLLKRSTLSMSNDGFLTINKERTFILYDLFKKEVICPYYYDQKLREQVDILASTGDLRYGNTLFSEPEQDYLNYILNKSEFSNGFDLRNRYCHDTCSLDEKTQSIDYLELQKIMILIIIKINEELCNKSMAAV